MTMFMFFWTSLLACNAVARLSILPRAVSQQIEVTTIYRLDSGALTSQCLCYAAPPGAASPNVNSVVTASPVGQSTSGQNVIVGQSPGSGSGVGAVGANVPAQAATPGLIAINNGVTSNTDSGTTSQIIAQYINGAGFIVQVIVNVSVNTISIPVISSVVLGPGITQTITTTTTVQQTTTITTTSTNSGTATIAPGNTMTTSGMPFRNSTVSSIMSSTSNGAASVSAVQTMTSSTSASRSSSSVPVSTSTVSTCAFIPAGCTSSVQSFCSSLAAQGLSTLSNTIFVSTTDTTSTRTNEVTVVDTILSLFPSETDTITVTSIALSSTTTSLLITSSTDTTTTTIASSTSTPPPLTLRKRAASSAMGTTIGTCAISDYSAACACVGLTLSSQAPSSVTETDYIRITASTVQTTSTTTSTTEIIPSSSSVTSTTTTTTTTEVLTSVSITTTTSTSSSTSSALSTAPTIIYTRNFAIEAFDVSSNSLGFGFYRDFGGATTGGQGALRVFPVGTGPDTRPANQDLREFALSQTEQRLVLSTGDGTHPLSYAVRNGPTNSLIGLFNNALGPALFCRAVGNQLSCGFSTTSSGSFGQCGSNAPTYFDMILFFDVGPTADINQICKSANYGFGRRVTLQIEFM